MCRIPLIRSGDKRAKTHIGDHFMKESATTETLKKPTRILTLVTEGLLPVDIAKEKADQFPRASLYGQVLGTDILNEQFMAKVPRWRRRLYKHLPFTAAQMIEAYLIRRKYDVVISWAERPALAFAAVRMITRSKIPHVALVSWISRPKKAMVLKRVHKNITTLVLWSTAQRDFAVNRLGIPPEKVAMVRWFTDQRFFRPFGRQTDMICSAGREMRDYLTLIKAMDGLDIKCHIAVAFRGKIYETVRAALELKSLPPNVTVGNLPLTELRELYARSRFVVIPLLPTDTDNGLTVMLESMAMGKAVICSRVNGQTDIIEEGVTGIYVPQGDADALRQAIKHLWDRPEMAEKMGQEARKRIEEKYTLDGFVAKMKCIAEEAAEKQRTRRLS